MDLLQEITDRVMNDPIAAKTFFGLTAKPNATWLKKVEPGVSAAQCLWDDTHKTTTEPGPIAAPTPDLKESDFSLENTADAQPQEAPRQRSGVSELIGKLRAKVRVPDDATPEQVLAAVLGAQWARKATMLTPLALPVLPWVHFAHMAQLRTQPWLGYFQETDTIIQRARNRCAQHFLESEAEWSWWVDGDIVPPWGDPGFFYNVKRLGVSTNRISPDFLKVRALDRLLSHGKTIVGAVYQQRRVAGKICSPIDLRPDGVGDKDHVQSLRKYGPKDKLIEVEWAATGCLLVHRTVYTDIMKRFPERAPKAEGEPWDFFGHDVSRMGEDAAFGLMAKQAGHQSYLDLGLWVAHVGNFAYMPELLT
jgi:hypothetical protein